MLEVPTVTLEQRTLVHHEEEERDLFYLPGVLPLPLGAELAYEGLAYRVIGVRFTRDEPLLLVLDVKETGPRMGRSVDLR
jgi:hypothetical protein